MTTTDDLIQKELSEFDAYFEDGWQHWLFLSDFKGGVNFRSFKNGIKSHIKYSFQEALHKIKDEAKREAIEKINGMKKNKGSTESISDAVFLGYNQALDDVLNSLKEDGGE